MNGGTQGSVLVPMLTKRTIIAHSIMFPNSIPNKVFSSSTTLSIYVLQWYPVLMASFEV